MLFLVVVHCFRPVFAVAEDYAQDDNMQDGIMSSFRLII